MKDQTLKYNKSQAEVMLIPLYLSSRRWLSLYTI